MAQTPAQFSGWSYEDSSLLSEDNAPKRRRGRSRNSEPLPRSNIVLKRTSDNLELTVGDCVMYYKGTVGAETKEENFSVAIITRISLDTEDYVEVCVCWFYKKDHLRDLEDVDKIFDIDKVDSNELFLTAMQNRIQLKYFRGKVTVASHTSIGYFCQRASDTYYLDISNTFDLKELVDTLKQDQKKFLTDLKSILYKNSQPGFSVKKPQSVLNAKKALHSQKNKKPLVKPKPLKEAVVELDDILPVKKLEQALELEDSDQDSIVTDDAYFSLSSGSLDVITDDEVYDDDDDDDFVPNNIRKLHRKRKTMRNKTPRKKRVKLKISETTPKIPTRVIQLQNGESDVVMKSPVKSTVNELMFKDAKEKLHTATLLNSLPCREEEFAQLYLALENLIQEQIGGCIYISGTPGTGKTATVRKVVTALEKRATNVEDPEPLNAFDFIEINGLKLISPDMCYELLWEKISGKRVSALASKKLIENHLNENEHNGNSDRKSLIVVLDEIDQIITNNQTIVYNFLNWPTYTNSRLIVVAIANTMDLPERALTNKISSRLGLSRLTFSGYKDHELVEIIQARLESMNKDSTSKVIFNKNAIDLASKRVARASGDARRGLAIVRRAVELGEMEYKEGTGKLEVTMDLVMRAMKETTDSPIAYYIMNLSVVAKIFLCALLRRQKYTGFAESEVNDTIEEMKRIIHLNFINDDSPNLKTIMDDNKNVFALFLTSSIIGIAQVINQLMEAGVIIQEDNKVNYSRFVRLTISEDEIYAALRKEKIFQKVLG